MTENMIEEVLDLHVAVHQEALLKEEIEERYDCELTISNIQKIRDKLSRLHMQIMYPTFGSPNFNEL